MKNELQKNSPNLDELDLMLVHELWQDGRTPYLELASKLGASHATVRRRVAKLIDRGVITIVAMPAAAALGYQTVMVLAISTPPGTVNMLAEQLSSINAIKHVWITAGRYDLMAAALYRNPSEYINSFSKELNNLPDNIRIETLLSVKAMTGIYAFMTHNNSDIGSNSRIVLSELDFYLTHDNAAIDSNSRIELSELDFSVLKGLQDDPRVSVTRLSAEIGAKSSVVRSSLNKLLSEGLVRVMGIPNQSAFGYSDWGVTLIQIHPSSLEVVINELKGHPRVGDITITLGAFNCMIWTSFQNSDQLSDFLAQDLGNMPGIVHYESLVTLRVIKKSFRVIE